ncbi:MAG: transcriptional regulator, GntR family [Paucimonas sp.]|nr:transcriptional regulator, GntR family [Paucimonas sp.]
MNARIPSPGLVRVKLAPQIVERLRQEIVTGVWAPGESLPANVLSAKFGTSHIPIREALLVLESEGFLRLAPNRMAIVTEPTIAATSDKLVLLRTLEGLAAELACTQATPAGIDELLGLQGEVERHFNAGDVAGYHLANQVFHRRLVEMSGNQSLMDVHQMLTRHLEWARVRSGIRTELLSGALGEHQRIIACMRSRDGGGARRMAEEHFLVVSEAIIKGLRETRPD